MLFTRAPKTSDHISFSKGDLDQIINSLNCLKAGQFKQCTFSESAIGEALISLKEALSEGASEDLARSVNLSMSINESVVAAAKMNRLMKGVNGEAKKCQPRQHNYKNHLAK